MKFSKEYRARYSKKVWGFRGRVGGERIQVFGFDTREEAERAADDLRLKAIEGRYRITPKRAPVTLAELVAEAVRDLDTGGNRNHKRKKVILEMFRDHLGGGAPVADLEESDILSYKRARVGRSKLKPNSINRELEAVAAMFNAAGKFFPALKSWKHPRMPYERKDEAGRERVITPEEERRMLAALREPRRPGRAAGASAGPRAAEQVLAHRTRLIVADLWELAPLVGMRRSELRKLEKSWVALDEALVRLPKHATKTKRARVVPLNADALAILRRRVGESPHPRWVFTNARGANVMSEYQMYRALRKAAARAGLTWGQQVEGGFTLHDTRHTAVTRMLEGGTNLATVADVVGHSKETMTLRYAHASLESKRRAVAVLGQKSGGRDNQAAADSEVGAATPLPATTENS